MLFSPHPSAMHDVRRLAPGSIAVCEPSARSTADRELRARFDHIIGTLVRLVGGH